MFRWLRLRLRNAFDEIIRRHVRARAGRAGAFAWPREMAVMAIKLFGHHVDVREEANEEIRQRVFVRVLRKIDAQGTALRAANCAGNSAFSRVPVLQKGIGLFKLVSGDFQMNPVNACAIVKVRRNSRILQSPLILFAVDAPAKKCNGDFVHN